MASLVQARKICELYQDGYLTVENPEYKDLDPMDIPIGGPVMMQSPEGKLFKVFADGSMVLYENSKT